MRGLPFRVTVFIWMVLWFSAWNALRLWSAISWRARLFEFASRPGPLYIGVTGALWLAAGLVILWALLRRKSWTNTFILAAALAYTAWYWADRLLLRQRDPNWPFMLILNILLLVLVFFTTRASYLQREAYERQSEN